MNNFEIRKLLKKAYKSAEQALEEILGEEYSKYVLERVLRRRFLRWILIILVLCPALIFILDTISKLLGA